MVLAIRLEAAVAHDRGRATERARRLLLLLLLLLVLQSRWWSWMEGGRARRRSAHRKSAVFFLFTVIILAVEGGEVPLNACIGIVTHVRTTFIHLPYCA